MGFLRVLNKTKGFLNKAVHKTSGFGNKVLHGIEKGTDVVHKILNVADKVDNALTNVPIIGGLAGEIKPFINGGRMLTGRAENALKKLEKKNNKLNKLKL
jgi:hypothetical protein